MCTSRYSFFFQAEDGIRYLTVTGVQTCALPIFGRGASIGAGPWAETGPSSSTTTCSSFGDRKSTRLNSSHSQISYAVFCLKENKGIDMLLYSFYDSGFEH